MNRSYEKTNHISCLYNYYVYVYRSKALCRSSELWKEGIVSYFCVEQSSTDALICVYLSFYLSVDSYINLRSFHHHSLNRRLVAYSAPSPYPNQWLFKHSLFVTEGSFCVWGQTVKYEITMQRRLPLAGPIPCRNTSTDGTRSTVDTICSFSIPLPLYQNIRLISRRITPGYQWYIQARLYAYCIIFASIFLAILPGVSMWQARLLDFVRLNIMSHRKPAGVPTSAYFETRTRPPLITFHCFGE